MKNLKISQIQFQAKAKPDDNCNQLESYYKKALKFRPDIICTPECSNIITNDKKHLFKFSTYQNECPILSMSKNFAKRHKLFINIGSLLLKVKNENKLINRSFIIDKNGSINSFYDKIHMFDVKINCKETYFESKFFKPGRELVLVKTPFAKIGLTICYDVRFPYLFSALKNCGADIICVPSAFTVKTGKDHWETLLKARAIENQIFIIAPAQCGQNTSSRKTWGHSVIIDPNGKILCDLGNKIDYDVIQLKNH